MSDTISKISDACKVLQSELSNDPAIELVDFSRQWVDQTFRNFFSKISIMDLHNPRGKLIDQGRPSVFELYTLLSEEGREMNDAEILHALALDWCIDWLQAYFLDLDDILDKPLTRRDQDCWFKAPKVRMFCAQDGVILQQRTQRVLKKHFSEETYYVDLLELFREAEFQSAMGQMNYLLITNVEEEKKLSNFTFDLYCSIVHYKRSKYSLYLPVACALIMSGEKLEDHLGTKRILIDMEKYFQVQNDYFDCFGDPQCNKTGTDIEDFKCSWLVVKALELCNEEQIKILHENYGKQDPACVAKVKQLYNDLNLEGEFADYGRKSYESLIKSIEEHTNTPAVKSVLKSLLAEVYKRQQHFRNQEITNIIEAFELMR